MHPHGPRFDRRLCGFLARALALALAALTYTRATAQSTLAPLPRDEPLNGIAGTPAVSAIGDPDTGYSFLAMGNQGIAVLGLRQTWFGSTFVGGFARRLALADKILCVAAEKAGLQLVDVTDPRLPRRIGVLDLDAGAVDVAVAGATAFVADGAGALHCVDISRPTDPVRLGGLPATTSTPVTLSLAVQGSLLAVAASWEGLRLVDVSRPSAPQPAGRMPIAGAATAVAIDPTSAHRIVFVAGTHSELIAIDASEPARPVQVGNLTLPRQPTCLAAANGYVYVGDDLGGFRVVDAREPASLNEVPPGFPASGPWQTVDLSVAGNRLYHTLGHRPGGGTYSHLLTVPTQPRLESFWIGESRVGEVILRETGGAVTMAAGHASGVTQPRRVGILEMSGFEPPRLMGSLPGFGPLAMERDRVYCFTDVGFTVVDASVPTRPVVVSSLPIFDVRHLAVVEGRAYLYRWGRLDILDVTAQPRSLGLWSAADAASSYELDGTLLSLDRSRLAVAGSVSAGGGWVELLNVADPARTTSLARIGYPEGTEVQAVGLESNLLAVATVKVRASSDSLLELHDMSGGPVPSLLASLPLPGRWSSLQLRRGRIYAVSTDEGFQIIDVRQPKAPRVEARLTGHRGTRISVGVSEAMVAEGTEVRVLRALPGLAPILRITSASPGQALTVEHAPSLSSEATWTPLIATNPPVPGVLFRDTTTEPGAFDQRYYRVR